MLTLSPLQTAENAYMLHEPLLLRLLKSLDKAKLPQDKYLPRRTHTPNYKAILNDHLVKNPQTLQERNNTPPSLKLKGVPLLL